MKKTLLTLIALVVVTGLSVLSITGKSLNNLPDEDDVRYTYKKSMTPKAFSAIEVDCDAEVTVYYTQGSKYQVRVSTNKDITDKIITTQNGRKVKVAYNRGSIFSSPTYIRIHVTSPTLEGFTCTGDVDLKARKINQSTDLTIKSSVETDIELDNCTCRNLTINNSGEIDIDGNFKITKALTINSSRDTDMEIRCKAQTITLKLSGESDGDLNVNCQKLVAHSSGRTEVEIAGRAAVQNIKSSGSTSFRTFNLKKK